MFKFLCRIFQEKDATIKINSNKKLANIDDS